MIAALEEGNHAVTHITKDRRFEHNNNKYGNSTKDVEFLGVLSRDELAWVVISGDSNIVDTPHERAALIASGLTFFAFDDHWAKANAYDQARKLVGIRGNRETCQCPGPDHLQSEHGKKAIRRDHQERNEGQRREVSWLGYVGKPRLPHDD